MTIPSDIARLLYALRSEEWVAVHEAVEAAGDWLRSAKRADPFSSVLGKRLVELATHPKWEVRRAVAHALEHLGHQRFHEGIEELRRDENPWVRAAADRTLNRRSELSRADMIHRDQLQKWRADLAGKYGPKAGAAAMRVAEDYANLLVREAAHEILSGIAPMDVALTNLQATLGRKRVNRSACEKHIDVCQRRLKHLADLIESLRQYTDTQPLESRREQIRALIEESVAQVESGLPGPLAVTLVVDPTLAVDGNRTRLLQALTNLIRNAVEAYEDGEVLRPIRIEASLASSRKVALSIRDEGRGMSDEELRDSVQLYSTRKRGGIGFGLPLAKKIIEAEHGGELSLESELGLGTTVRVVLPIEQCEGIG